MDVPKDILLIQTAYLGDVVLTTPLLERLHQGFPLARIHVLLRPRADDLLINHPAVHACIVYDKRKRDRGWMAFRDLARSIRRRHFDLALCLQQSVRSGLLAWHAGIARRFGFRKAAGALFYTDHVPHAPGKHQTDRYLAFADALGLDASSALPRLYPDAAQHEQAARILRRHGLTVDAPMIAVAPGSVWPTKRWPREKFKELIRKLARRFAVALLGGPDEQALGEYLAQGRRFVHPVINTMGSLGIMAGAALIQQARACVTNDSANLHIGVAMGTPVIALYGPTHPSQGFAPVGPGHRVMHRSHLACRPCSMHGGGECPLGHWKCMRDLHVDAVEQAVYAIVS